MTERIESHTGLWHVPKAVLPALALASALLLALAPGSATATASAKFNAQVSMHVSVLSDGSIRGATTQTLRVTRTDKPSGVLQSCDKVGAVAIQTWVDFFNHRVQNHIDVGRLELKPGLCSFTKTIKYHPFTDAELKAACVGGPHTLRKTMWLRFRNWNSVSERSVNLPPFKIPDIHVTAYVSCPASPGPATNTSAPAHTVNKCNFSGEWPVWQAAPGRQATVPFALVANEGRSDVYQVSTPNAAGVSGTAVVTGYAVRLNLQSGGNDPQMQIFNGRLDRSCSNLTGQAVRSDPPVGLRAARRGGRSRNTTRSVHRNAASAGTQHRAAVPNANRPVAPKWNTQLR